VAEGAALMAGILGGCNTSDNIPVVCDVAPLSVSLEIAGDKVS